MELVTLIILVILCGIGILLALRMITYALRFASVLVLIIFIIGFVGYYFSAQAYILPNAHTTYVTITSDGGFVIAQQKALQYNLDSTATAAYNREFIKPLRSLNTTTFGLLKEFAHGDFFTQSDTVWLVNAINRSECAQDKIIREPNLFATECLSNLNYIKSQAKVSNVNSSSKFQYLSDASNLNRIPLKANFKEWLINYFVN